MFQLQARTHYSCIQPLERARGAFVQDDYVIRLQLDGYHMSLVVCGSVWISCMLTNNISIDLNNIFDLYGYKSTHLLNRYPMDEERY